MLHIISLVDTVAPVISCINDVADTVNSGVTGKTVTWTEPTATDNSGIVTLTQRTHAPGAFFPVGTTEVSYTFTDGSGNSATCTFNVNVIECKFIVWIITYMINNNPTPTLFILKHCWLVEGIHVV